MRIIAEIFPENIEPSYMMFWFSVGDTVNGRNANCYYVRFYTDKIEFYSMQTGAWKLVNGSGVTGELYLTGTNLTGNCSKFIRLGTDNKLFESTENKPSEG